MIDPKIIVDMTWQNHERIGLGYLAAATDATNKLSETAGETVDSQQLLADQQTAQLFALLATAHLTAAQEKRP